VVGEFGSGNNYLSALNTWGANGLLARHTRAGVWYYTFDMQGNVSQKLNAQGAVLSSSIFDPAGNQATNDPNPDPYSGFGGQWGYVSDYETGLTLLGHRFYDNNTQRFLTRDPIGYDGGINLYAYVGNNPVNETDHLGLAPDWGKGLDKCKKLCKPAATAFLAIAACFTYKTIHDDLACSNAIQQAGRECQKEMEETPTTGNPNDDNLQNIPGLDGPYGNGSGNAIAARRACMEKKLKGMHMPNINKCLAQLFKDGAGTYGSAPGGPSVPYIPGH